MMIAECNPIACTESCFCNKNDPGTGYPYNFTVEQQFCFEPCID